MRYINKILLALGIIMILSSGCYTGKKDKDKEYEKNSENEISANTKAENSIITPTDSGIVKIELKDGKGKIQIRKEQDQNIYVEFLSQGYRKINGYLSSPDSTANIRFSQITLPDGTMDGPFGRDIEYELPSDGTYKLSIHENMMAGDPWSGIVNVKIELSE